MCVRYFFPAVSVLAILSAPSALANSPSDAAEPQKVKKSQVAIQKAAIQKLVAPPCARGKWKDDPVCFGEDDRLALPTPSSRSAPDVTGRRSGDIAVFPRTSINQSAGQSASTYGSGATAAPRAGGGLGGGMGGGLMVKLPF